MISSVVYLNTLAGTQKGKMIPCYIYQFYSSFPVFVLIISLLLIVGISFTH